MSNHVISSTHSPLEDKYSKVFLITINHSNAGFFVQLNFTINQLAYCEKHNYLPVVYFGPWSVDGPNRFHDPRYGKNMWDYYFEPVAGYTYNDIKLMVESPDNPLTEDEIIKLSSEELWYLHYENPDSVYNYPFGYYKYEYLYDEDWYQKQRQKARYYSNRYIRIKSHILNEVDAFYKEHFQAQHVLGIHMRGTDKGIADSVPHLNRIVKPREYFPFIDKYTRENGYCKIFVATDQEQFLTEMKTRYRERIISYDSVRSKSFVNAFQKSDGNNYNKGKEVLIDCLLLSRCNFLLKCTSAVGEHAMYFNPKLHCIDLNHVKKKWSFLANLSVEFARGKRHGYAFRRKRLIEAWNPSKLTILCHFLIYNPILFMLNSWINKHRYSKSVSWYLFVSAKDYILKLLLREGTPLSLITYRARHRWKRRGAACYEPVNARVHKYLEIINDWDFKAVFFTQFLYVLKQLRFSEIHNLIPVVNMDQKFNFYYDPNRGENVWEYYFEPVSELSAKDLEKLPPEQITFLRPHKQSTLYIGDGNQAPTEYNPECEKWYHRQRAMGAQLVKKYIRVKKHILLKVERFYTRYMKGHNVLGVHLRGTDKGFDWDGRPYEASYLFRRIVPPEEYWPFVDKYVSLFPTCKIFVATDQQQVLEQFKDRYGNRVLFTDATRSTPNINPKKVADGNGYKKGEEVLIDALLLSRANFLLKCTSNVGEVAIYFNPTLRDLDLSYKHSVEDIDFGTENEKSL